MVFVTTTISIRTFVVVATTLQRNDEFSVVLVLVHHAFIAMTIPTTEMVLGGMNKSGIGHAGHDSGDDGHESEEIHYGVVFRFNTGVCFGVCGSVDYGNSTNGGKVATEPPVVLLCVL